MLKIAFTETDPFLLSAIIAGFSEVPELMRMTTPELISSEAKKILYTLRSISDNKIAAQKAKIIAKERALELLKQHQDAELRDIKIEQKIQQKENKAREAEERVRVAEIARAELKEFCVSLQNQNLSPSQSEALRYFKYIYLDGKRDPEISYMFPGTTREQRYQWKTRAIKMIAPLVSEDAKKFISERTKIKYAETDVLFKMAGIYFEKCLEGSHE